MPRRIPPVKDETVESYVDRLAAGNHLDARDLIDHLTKKRWQYTPGYHRIPLDALAAVSGFSRTSLAYALPQMRPDAEHHQLHLTGRATAREPNHRRPACRRCMAGKGITSTVTIWARADQNVCLRHQLWIGPGVDSANHQLDVSDLPEIGRAQIRHDRLIRRFGHGRINYYYYYYYYYYTDAYEVDDWSTRNRYVVCPRNDRRRYLFNREQSEVLPFSYGYAAQHPEVIGVLGVIVSPFWRRLAISDDPTDQQRFYAEIKKNGLYSGNPEANTPLRRWIRDHRRDRSPDDPDGEKELQYLYESQSGTIPLNRRAKASDSEARLLDIALRSNHASVAPHE
jgi:hypothetical protein